jgi:hypothetical protein
VTARRAVTRWITPQLVRIDLAHATHTTGNRDGWWITTRHPRSGVLLHEWRLPLGDADETVRAAAERDLYAALAAVDAVPVLVPRRADQARRAVSAAKRRRARPYALARERHLRAV